MKMKTHQEIVYEIEKILMPQVPENEKILGYAVDGEDVREVLFTILQERDREVREMIEETINEKAKTYNTEWGVNTCAALMATKIKLLSQLPKT